eukprot:scaffold4.g4710.t1
MAQRASGGRQQQQQQGGIQHAVEARFSSARSLLSALQAIRGTVRQSCVLEFSGSGMEVRWQDEARMMQSKVGFSTAVSVGGRWTAEDGAEGATPISSYASISTQEMVAPLTDLAEGWQQPQSYFIAQGGLLKEVIDDLEWTGGEVAVAMRRNPPELRFLSTKQANSLEARGWGCGIQVPHQQLIGFDMSQPEVKWTYKYKQLKAAFSNIPLRDGAAVSTKVAIDANGMMGVVHLLTLQSAAAEPQEVSHPLATFSSQATVMNTSRRTAVNWVLLPHDDQEDEEQGGDSPFKFVNYSQSPSLVDEERTLAAVAPAPLEQQPPAPKPPGGDPSTALLAKLKAQREAVAQRTAPCDMLVLYASHTGTCQMIAEDIHSQAQRRGLRTRLAAMDEWGLARVSAAATPRVVLVASTIGGCPPANGTEFYNALCAPAAAAGSLAGVAVGVLGLGDSSAYGASYMTVPRTLRRRLLELGAAELCPSQELDGVGGIEKHLEKWVDGLWAPLAAVAAAAAPAGPAAAAPGLCGEVQPALIRAAVA